MHAAEGVDTYLGGDGADEIVIASGVPVSRLFLTTAASIEKLIMADFGGRGLLGTVEDDQWDLSGVVTQVYSAIDLEAGNDIFVGTQDLDFAYGGSGHDTMDGGRGNDFLIGEEGDDQLSGAVGSDELSGGDGDDKLLGDAGNDTLIGNVGNDSHIGGLGDDFFTILTRDSGIDNFDGGEGLDTLRVYWTEPSLLSRLTVDAASSVEVLDAANGINGTPGDDRWDLSGVVTLLLNPGNALFLGDGNDSFVGTHANDTVQGSNGDDTLDGGRGDDTLSGEKGSDTYVVDSVGDMIEDSPNDEGIDTVRASVTWTLSALLENLFLTGRDAINGTGNAAANTLTGNSGANLLFGGGENDTLSGGGGADTLDGGTGTDSLSGGSGDDSYVIEAVGETTYESSAGGIDTVLTGLAIYTLQANVERLTLTAAGAADGIGNASANLLVGTAGNNILDGREGADTMQGGLGDDSYSVENAGDVIVELAGEGTDTAKTNLAAYTLATTLENLTLTGSAHNRGTGNDQANGMQGNAGNNTLLGGKGDDTLNGGAGNDSLDGGTGADKLVGGAGNDTYNYGTLDRIEEAANGGIDTVNSAINISLGSTLENVNLVGNTATIANGNALANVINGNALANTLKGGAGDDTMNGGAGDDVLFGGKNRDMMTGGTGNDTFSFEGLADSTVAAPDTITDLQAGDKLDFSLIDANTALAGNQAFVQVAVFSNQAGQLVMTINSTTNRTSVVLDVDGDSAGDMTVQLTGQFTSAAGWAL